MSSSNSYIDGKLAGWHRIADEHVEALPTIRYLASWLDEHRPPPAPFCLIHGDLQSSNIVVALDGSWSLIDWEFAHIGDPRLLLSGPHLIPNRSCAASAAREGSARRWR